MGNSLTKRLNCPPAQPDGSSLKRKRHDLLISNWYRLTKNNNKKINLLPLDLIYMCSKYASYAVVFDIYDNNNVTIKNEKNKIIIGMNPNGYVLKLYSIYCATPINKYNAIKITQNMHWKTFHVGITSRFDFSFWTLYDSSITLATHANMYGACDHISLPCYFLDTSGRKIVNIGENLVLNEAFKIEDVEESIEFLNNNSCDPNNYTSYLYTAFPKINYNDSIMIKVNHENKLLWYHNSKFVFSHKTDLNVQKYYFFLTFVPSSRCFCLQIE